MKKKILLTGSSGFIGSYFLDNYQDIYDISTFSLQNAQIEHIDFSTIDTVVHLAALVHQMSGVDDIRDYYSINIDYTITLAKKAKENGVKHFVFMSSVKVYGEENDTAYTEDSPTNPQDDYGKSKLEAENELLKLQDSNFDISIIRTPIIYGANVKANLLNLARLVYKTPILPFGGIDNRRSMVYIGNLCDMISKIIDLKINGIFLAKDSTLSTSELIRLIAKGFDKDIVLVNIPFLKDLIRLIKPNIYKRLFLNLEVNNQKTIDKLNFKPRFDTQYGIKQLCKNIK